MMLFVCPHYAPCLIAWRTAPYAEPDPMGTRRASTSSCGTGFEYEDSNSVSIGSALFPGASLFGRLEAAVILVWSSSAKL